MKVPYSVMSPGALKAYGPGISWAVLPGDGVTLVYWVFEPPACGAVPMHQHDIAQSGVVLEGSLTMQYEGGARKTLRAGEFYTVARNVGHGVEFSERCVVMDIFTPNRREYEERYAQGATSEAFVASA